MSLPRNPITKIAIPYLPKKVALSDVKQAVVGADGVTRLFILSEAERKQILKMLHDKLDGRYSKSKKAHPDYQLTMKSDYSVIKYEGRCYAVYKGLQQRAAAGAGSFGVVKHIQDIESGEWRVVKNFSEFHRNERNTRFDFHNLKELAEEANAEFKQVKKIQLAPDSKMLFRNTGNKRTQYLIVMDEARGQDLSDVQENFHRHSSALRITSRKWLSLFHSMAANIHQLHQMKLLHRDIKPGNFLYDFKQTKLIDLNLCVDMSEDIYGSIYGDNVQGTPLTLAPEIWKPGRSGKFHYSTKSDAFALGVSIAYMLNLALPKLRGATELCSASDENVVANPFIQNKVLLKKIHAICKELMLIDVDKRLTVEEAMLRFATLLNEHQEKFKIGVIDVAEFKAESLTTSQTVSLLKFDEIVLIDTSPQPSIDDCVRLRRHLERNYLNVRDELYKGASREEIVDQIQHEQAAKPPFVISVYSNSSVENAMLNNWRLVKRELENVSFSAKHKIRKLDAKRKTIAETWEKIEPILDALTPNPRRVHFQVSAASPKERAEAQGKGKSRSSTKINAGVERLQEDVSERVLLDDRGPQPQRLQTETLTKEQQQADESADLLIVQQKPLSPLETQIAAWTHQVQELVFVTSKLNFDPSKSSLDYWQPLRANLQDLNDYLLRSDVTSAQKYAYIMLKQHLIVAVTQELVKEAEAKAHRLAARHVKPAQQVADPDQEFVDTWLSIENLIADTDAFLHDQEQTLERKQAYLASNLQQLKVLRNQLLTGKVLRRDAKFFPTELQQQKQSVNLGVQTAKTMAKRLVNLQQGLQAIMALEANGRLAMETMEQQLSARAHPAARRIHPLELQADFTQLSKFLAILEIYQRRYHEARHRTPQLDELALQLRALREALLNDAMNTADKLDLFKSVEKKLRLASIETQQISLRNHPNHLWLQDMKIEMRLVMANLTKTLQPAGIPIQAAPASPLTIQTINRLKAPLQEYATQLRKQKHPNLRRARMTLELIQKLEDLIMVLARNNPDLIQDRMTKVTLLIDKLYREGDLKEHRHFNFLKQAIGRKTKLEVMVENIDAVIRPLDPAAPVKDKGHSKKDKDNANRPLLRTSKT